MTASEETELAVYQHQHQSKAPDTEAGGGGDESFRDPNKPVIVGVQMFFSRTGELDMVNQNFFTEFDLVLEWQPTKQEVDDYIKDPKSFVPSWIPIIQFKNGNIQSKDIKIISDNQGFRVIGPKCETADVYGNPLRNLRYPYIIEVMYITKGTFSEFLELHNFPMDCQDLKISMQLMDSIKNATFAPYLNAKADVVQVALKYNGLEEYDMVPPVVEFYTNQYSEAFSAMNIVLKVKRKYHIYFWKIVIFVGLICLASLAAFTMHQTDDLADRYGLLFTLLLTQVAFQYVVSESLPSLTYLTLLDFYVLAGFLYLMIQIVGVGIIGGWDLSEDIDNLFGFISIGLFCVFQLGFMLWVYYARQYELRKLTFTSNDYKVHNYMQFRSLQARSVCYGVSPEKLEFTQQAREQLEGSIWDDLQAGK